MNHARAKSAANFSSLKSAWMPWSAVILLLMLLSPQRGWAQCTMCGKMLVRFGLNVERNCTVVLTYGSETKTFVANDIPKSFGGNFKVDTNAGGQPLTSGSAGQTQDVEVKAKLTQFPPGKEVTITGSVGCCGLSVTPKGTLSLWHHAPPVPGNSGGGNPGDGPANDPGGWKDVYQYEIIGFPTSDDAAIALQAFVDGTPATESMRIVPGQVTDAGDGTYSYTATLQTYSEPNQDQDPDPGPDPMDGGPPGEPAPDQLEDRVTIHIEVPGVGSGEDEDGSGELGDGGMSPQPSPPPGGDEDPQKLPMSWVWDFGKNGAGAPVGTLALITDLADANPLDLSKFSTRASKPGGLIVGTITGLSGGQAGWRVEAPEVNTAALQASLVTLTSQLTGSTAILDDLNQQLQDAHLVGEDTTGSALENSITQQTIIVTQLQNQVSTLTIQIPQSNVTNATRVRMDVVKLSSTMVEVRRFPRVDGALPTDPSVIHRFELTTASGMPAIKRTVINGNSQKVDLAAGVVGGTGGREWRIEAPDSTVRVGIEAPWDAGQQITDASMYLNAGAQLQLRIVTVRVNKPWGVEVVEESVYDSDAPGTVPVVTSYTFYENAAEVASYGKLKWRTCTDGTWQRYDYLTTGETRSFSPWKDGPASPDLATQANARCIQTSADGQTVTESIAGTVVSISTSQTTPGVSHPNHPNSTGFTRTQSQRMSPAGGGWLTSTSYMNDGSGHTEWNKDESGNITSYEEQLMTITTTNGDILVTRRVRTQELQPWTAGTPATPAPLQEAEYTDSNGRMLRKEIWAPNGGVSSTTDNSYDGTSSRQTQVVQDGQVIYDVQSSTDGSGNQVAIETDAQGVRTRIITSPSGEVLSQSKLAVDGTTVLLTTTTNKVGLTTTTMTKGGGLSRRSAVTQDAQGRTLQQVDENGVTTNYSYQDNGRTVVVKDAAGNTLTTTKQYLDGQLKSIEGSAAVEEYHNYSVGTDGLITETVNYGTASGAMYRKHVTNGLGQRVRDIEPLQQDGGTSEKVTQYTYDENGRLSLTQTTGMAPVKTLYDGLSRPAVQRMLIGANGTESVDDPMTTFIRSYTTMGSGLWAVVTTHQAVDDNPSHDLISVSKQQIGGSGQVQTSQSPNGAILTQTTAVNPATATVTTTLSSNQATRTAVRIVVNGLLQSETSLSATTATAYSYDGLERQLTMTTPDGVVHKTIYDDAADGSARSRVLKDQLVPANGGTAITQATYAYDSKSRVESVTRVDNSSVSYTYDDADHVLTQTGTGTYPLRYEYDDLGRLWKLHTYRDASKDDVTVWNYHEASGNLLSKTDAATSKVSYSYDEGGRVFTRTWQRGVTTTYGYDGAGRQNSIDYSDTTPDVSVTYDRAGRRVGTTDAAGTHVFTYDDPASGGQLSGWSVSGAGTWSGLSVGYGNSNGRRTSRETSLGSITLPGADYTYDPASGRMDSVTASGITATYRYDASTGWYGGVTYTGGLSSTRTPDGLGRLDSIAWSSGGATISGHDYTINPMNRRTDALRQDGSAWSYDYNDLGEVRSAAKVAEPGKDFRFAYDGIGNRISSMVSSVANPTVLRTTNYTPNALNQYDAINHPEPGWLVLRGSANTAAGATVKIDGNPATLSSGSLWSHEQSIDNTDGPVRREVEIAATRLDGGLNNGPVTTKQKGALFIPPASEVPTYDQDGNQTSDARWSYTWDGENRLIAVEEKPGIIVQPASTAPVKRTRLEFAYDGKSRRIGKSMLSATGGEGFVLQQRLVFLYDGWNMIAEIDTTTSAALLRSYEWGLDVSGTMTGAGGVGGLLIERFHAASSALPYLPAPGVQVPLYDGNGNVTELVNLANGSVSARYEYGAFGETISMDGGAVAISNPFRFSTKFMDGETGLYYYGYRYYDDVNGRWLSRDPIDEQGGISLYGMVGNDSVNQVDVLGLRDLLPEENSVVSKLRGLISRLEPRITSRTSEEGKKRMTLFREAVQKVLQDYYDTIHSLPDGSSGTSSFNVGNVALQNWAIPDRSKNFVEKTGPTCNFFVAAALRESGLPTDLVKPPGANTPRPPTAREWGNPNAKELQQYKIVWKFVIDPRITDGLTANLVTQIEIKLSGTFGNIMAGSGHCGICLGQGLYVSSTASTGPAYAQPDNDDIAIKPIPGSTLRPKDDPKILIRSAVIDGVRQ